MSWTLLPKERLSALVDALRAEGYAVVAPAEREGERLFRPVTCAEEIDLDYRNTRRSPKELFFPQTERLARYERQLDDYNQLESPSLETEPIAVLGLRPCDARSLILLDRVFLEGPYGDPYYQARRENTLIIALACDRPRRTCFCHALGSGPYDPQGADILMREAGDAYLLEGVTHVGRDLLGRLALPEADEAHRRLAAEIEARALASLAPIEPLEGIEVQLEPLFDDPVWQIVSEKCIACGTCTYNCPACHCFQIRDRTAGREGERVRLWDACMYPSFTLHASGHNPRPDGAARWRQRVMHKFSYLPENVGLYGCVGCGRCIESCPVQLDIRAVLRRLRAAARALQESPA
ncbi:MAG: 4Fe-4S dicluster domain-containing protein [Anaerolineae bacterium]|nr:4Fe-4S dicluster domain-containing protein [Anaerolineae bacterium]